MNERSTDDAAYLVSTGARLAVSLTRGLVIVASKLVKLGLGIFQAMLLGPSREPSLGGSRQTGWESMEEMVRHRTVNGEEWDGKR